MTDFLSEVLGERGGLVEREVTIGKRAGNVWFKRLTAGQKHQLLRGQKIIRQGNSTSMEFDLELNEEQRQRMVLFMVCKEDGSPRFAGLHAVRDVDAATVDALYEAARKLDEEEEAQGKG